jgi:hypothetical protein
VFVGIAKGKVAIDTTREDALTAATIGCLRYLPANLFFEWLSEARTVEGTPLVLAR